MTISNQVQTNGAVFSFGILFQAATAALLLYVKGHGSTIFQESRRLVLIIFLLSALMWAQFDFINFLVPITSPNVCQITTAVSSSFDQIGRVTIGSFLLWSVGHATKSPMEKYGLGALVAVRSVAGVVFVSFTRPQFHPLCVARSTLLPASIVVLALDGIIIGVLTIRVFTLGLLSASQEVVPSAKQEQSKSLLLCTLGFIVWTGTSITMILGLESIILLLRTAIPATGLMILVSIVTFFPSALLSVHEEDSRTAEARSPFVTSPSRLNESFSSQRNLTSGSPLVPQTYTKGNLFVVNPSNTPHDSPTIVLPGNTRSVEDDGTRKFGSTTTIKAMEIDDSEELRTRKMAMPGTIKRGSSGMFDTILAAPLSAPGVQNTNRVPQISNAPSTAFISVAATEQSRAVPASSPRKKSLFGRSRSPPKKGVRKVGISAPIVLDTDSEAVAPFARMRTVDLATAAASERHRREESVTRQLIANRPAPQPPMMAGAEGLRKSISTRRKQINPTHTPMPAFSNNGSENGLSVNVNASSTSASLSPGREDIRRRSPRNTNNSFDSALKQFDFSDATRGRLRTQLRNEPLPPDGRDARRQNPLRSMATNQETVMYIKDIVYDKPGTVRSIISGVPAMIAKAQPESVAPETPHSGSSRSILHRPRPYKRDTERESAFFMSEQSPRHKRNKSSGSIVTRKSIMQSHPGSPTGLPPLPPPPTSASRLQRLLPNDTRSMTVDEKILLLFPAPSGTRLLHKRGSSVPSIPRIPSLILQESGLSTSERDSMDRRASKRTTISFGAPPDIGDFSPKSLQDTKELKETYRFSANTYGDLVEAPRELWNASIQVPAVPDSPKMKGKSAWTETSSESGETQDDAKSIWTSLHSPVPAVEIRGVRANPIELRREILTAIDTSRELPALPSEAGNESTYTGEMKFETITFTLSDESILPTTTRQSFFLDSGPDSAGEQIAASSPKKTWHHRLGDNVPAFSERRKVLRSRAMPPPTPLLLSSSGRQATVVVKDPEPEIIDSPEKAIKHIQDQLKRFEESGRESLGSIIRHLPGQIPRTPSGDNDDRLGLLANLEAEMGQQENYWMQMQHNFDRDSNSIMAPSPAVQELQARGHPSPPSEVTSRSSSVRSVVRRPRIKSTATVRSSETTSTQSSDNSRASIWQQRLAEAQMEFTENAPALQQHRNLNFLSLQKPLPQPGSPTPPESLDSADDSTQFDSDSEVDDEPEAVLVPQAGPIATTVAPLWQPKQMEVDAIADQMWTSPRVSTVIRAVSPEPAAKSVRPKMRKIQHPLTLESSNLWSKPQNTRHIPPVGLWGTRLSRPRSIITRPPTQRPQRKSRRVTFLPDIVESPSPLPNKGGNLGVFQFPWGEKSDQAVYDPVPLPNRNSLLPLATLNPNLEARSHMLEHEEYESSFFDDYDDYDEYDMDDINQQDSDDDFDESTLWEIANLLGSKDVPSRDSLLPPARIIEDYDDSGDSDGELLEATQTRPSIVKFIPIQPLRSNTVVSPRKQLWTGENPLIIPANNCGLPQPDRNIWQTYIHTVEGSVRSKPRITVTLPEINSSKLWVSTSDEVTLHKQMATTMWTQPLKGSSIGEAMIPPSLWTARERKLVVDAAGLFIAGLERNDFRSSENSPAAINSIRKPRKTAEIWTTLTSQTMWTPVTTHTEDSPHWISISSAGSISPSPSSSSGRSSPSSPASDSSSIISTSTKASSLWSPEIINGVEAKTPAWWESKAVAATAILPHVDLNIYLSKLPVRKPSKRALMPLKSTEVLGSKSLWNVSVPTSEINFQKDWISVKSEVMGVKADEDVKYTESKTHLPRATPAHWMAALESAPPKIQRPSATTADWEAALAIAMSESAIKGESATSVQTVNDKCDESYSESTVTDSAHDIAITHPVFFTSCFETEAHFIHPAMEGYVQIQPRKQQAVPKLWTLSRDSAATTPAAPLWTPSTNTVTQPSSSITNISQPRVNKPTRTSATLPALTSRALWSPSVTTISAAKHWLHSTAKKPPPSPIPLPEILTKAVWLQPPRHTLFAKTMTSQGEHLSPAQTIITSIPIIDATSTASSSTASVQTETQTSIKALNRTKTLAPTGRKSVWTAPVRSNTVSASRRRGSALWDASEASKASQLNTLPATTFVPPTRANTVDVAPRRSSKRISTVDIEAQSVEESKKAIEGQATWRPTWGLPAKPTDWLNRPASRVVEFRY